MQGTEALLEQAAEVLDAIGIAERLDGNLGVEEFVHGNLEEIDVEDVSANGVMLNFLDQGKLGGTGDVEFDEDVLADGMLENRSDLTGVDLKFAGLILVPVDNGGNNTAGAEMLDGIATDIGAGPGGKFNLFCHKIRMLRRLFC
jgi:hypothetical protein